jgi:hypothetical protein
MCLPDLGNAHVIDWYLWNALQVQLDAFVHGTGVSINGRWVPIQEWRFDSEDWSRYDGELL